MTTISRANVADIGDLLDLPAEQIEPFMRVVRSSANIWVGFADGALVCVWGLAPPSLISSQAYLWLHVTPALVGHEFIFIRRSQVAVREMLEMYPEIVGHVEKGNVKAQRWLEWLGAKVHPSRGKLNTFIIKAAV